MHLVRDGKPIPEHYYTTPYFGHGWRARRGGSNERQIDDRRLAAFLARALTVVMPGLQEIHPPVRPLADALDETLGGYTGINLYALLGGDPRLCNALGRPRRVRPAGRRHKTLASVRRDPPLPAPRDAEPNVKPPRETVWSEVIRAGDVFYIPRGWWHDARTEPGDGADGAGSLHLSCSVLPPPGSTSWSGSPEGSPATRRSAATSPTPRTGPATPTTRHSGSSSSKSCKESSGGGSATTCDPPGPSARGRTSARPSSPGSLRLGALQGSGFGAPPHATMERNADGDVVPGGQRLPLDPRRPVHGADGPPAPGRDRAHRRLPGSGCRRGRSRRASASFVDELATLLVMRGIAQAVPPAAASRPER